MTKVVQVVPRIAKVSSGPSLSVPSLSVALNTAGCDVQLMALEPAPVHFVYENTRLFPCSRWPLAARFGVSPTMKQALWHAARNSNVIHTNSLWMMPNIYPEAAVRGTSCKLVVSPRGTFAPWALKRFQMRKRIVNWIGQRRCVESADCLHATSLQEVSQIRDAGLSNPIAVVPNGVACPTVLPPQEDRDEKTLLFLARIHPTKGVDILLEAWSLVQSLFPDWKLKIAGPTESKYAQQMIAKSRATERVQFSGMLTGQDKELAFRNSDLYVLPTHSENFGISVAEALSHGVPVIVFHGAPWQGLEDRNAGWWVPLGVDSLADTLKTAMSHSSSQLQQMGRNGHQWMQQEFDWQIIGRRMAVVYEWLVNGGSRPVDIFLD